MAISGERLDQLSKDKSVEALRILLHTLSEKHNLKTDELFDVIVGKQEESIPLSAFSSGLSALEVVVKFLKEEKNRRYSDIARLLNRDDRTIWATYSNSRKKSRAPLDLESPVLIPISIFSSRDRSPLEALVSYMKNSGYTVSQISRMLDKDYQTVYTTQRRGMSR